MTARKPRIQWFSAETRRKIQEEAIDVLERIGVFVEHEEAVSLLTGAGARVLDGAGGARIDPGGVDHAFDVHGPAISDPQPRLRLAWHEINRSGLEIFGLNNKRRRSNHVRSRVDRQLSFR